MDMKASPLGRRRLLQGTAAAAGGLILGSAVDGPGKTPALATTPVATPKATREYWIQCDSLDWNIVPSGKDELTGMTYAAADTTIQAVIYRAFTPNWGQPLPASADLGANSGIPGPVLRAKVGDTVVVHFKNNDTVYKVPRSMHPHGLKYDQASCGAWVAYDPGRPGTAVEFGQTYTYTWQAVPESRGAWVYHDHSKPQQSTGSVSREVMELGAELGLYGFIVVTDANTTPADREFFLLFQEWWMEDVKLPQYLMGFNGRAFVGNTPTLQAKVGDRVRWYVGELGKLPHVFHLHGHRWSNGSRIVDSQAVGASEVYVFDFVEDNPGDWLYHCHYPDHMMMGMAGRYTVTS